MRWLLFAATVAQRWGGPHCARTNLSQPHDQPGGAVSARWRRRRAMARVVAEKLSAGLGQQVVVENRAGGSGLVATRSFIKSAPDGYTLFLGHTGSISINPSLMPIRVSTRARISHRSA